MPARPSSCRARNRRRSGDRMGGSAFSAQVCFPSATTVAVCVCVCVCVSVSSELCVDSAMEGRVARQDQKWDDVLRGISEQRQETRETRSQCQLVSDANLVPALS